MVIISAEKKMMLVQPKYKVFVNGKEHSIIKGGEQNRFELPLGYHEIYLKMMLKTTKKMGFTIKSPADQIVITAQYNQVTAGISASMQIIEGAPAPVYAAAHTPAAPAAPVNTVLTCTGCGTTCKAEVGQISECEYCGSLLK